MIPEIKLINELLEDCNGTYLYTNDNQEDCKIIISKNSDDPNRTLIHEIIHHTIKEMKQYPEYEKIAHRIFRREDFIKFLAQNLSENLKFEIHSQSKQNTSQVKDED